MSALSLRRAWLDDLAANNSYEALSNEVQRMITDVIGSSLVRVHFRFMLLAS